MSDDTTSAALTRSQVAARLKIGLTSVRRLQASGALPCAKRDDGVHVFDAAAVEAFAAKSGGGAARATTNRTRDGETAAAAWEIYARGGDVFAAVTSLKITPDEARRLLAAFELSDAVLLPPRFVAELAAEGFGGENGRVTAGSILAAARRLRARARQAAQSSKSTRTESEAVTGRRLARK